MRMKNLRKELNNTILKNSRNKNKYGCTKLIKL